MSQSKVGRLQEKLIKLSEVNKDLLEACKALFNACMSSDPTFHEKYERDRFKEAMTKVSQAIARAEGKE